MMEHLQAIEWIPIDSIPKDGTVFIALEWGQVYLMKWSEDRVEIILDDPDSAYHKVHMWGGDFDYDKPEPTHWIPSAKLPAQ